jgi:hypothetical protein
LQCSPGSHIKMPPAHTDRAKRRVRLGYELTVPRRLTTASSEPSLVPPVGLADGRGSKLDCAGPRSDTGRRIGSTIVVAGNPTLVGSARPRPDSEKCPLEVHTVWATPLPTPRPSSSSSPQPHELAVARRRSCRSVIEDGPTHSRLESQAAPKSAPENQIRLLCPNETERSSPLTFGVRPTLKSARIPVNKRAREDSNL